MKLLNFDFMRYSSGILIGFFNWCIIISERLSLIADALSRHRRYFVWNIINASMHLPNPMWFGIIFNS